MKNIIEKALKAQRESKYIEFKSNIDVDNKGDWCELLKDIFALSNVGGGIILFGVDNNGRPTGEDVSRILHYDTADVVNKIYAYTHINYSDFDISEQRKNGSKIACMSIIENPIPLIPIRPGTYEKEKGRQHNAFSAGVIYYRHGAKSEFANSNDVADIIERRIINIRKLWMGGIRKVIKVTPRIETASKGIIVSSDPSATHFRLTNDIDAPKFQLINPDKTHPYRLKDLVNKVNELLRNIGIIINHYDVLIAMRVCKMESNIEYTYKPKYGTRIYSLAFAEWMVAKLAKDKYYFKMARAKYRRIKRGYIE